MRSSPGRTRRERLDTRSILQSHCGTNAELTSFAATLAFVVLLAGCSKVVVVKLPDNATAPANGVVYALPNTVVRVDLKIDKSTRVGAPFAAYAPIFAPNLSRVCEDPKCAAQGKEEISVEDDAKFSTFGEPDPENVFLVRFSGSGAIDQSLSMSWDEAGILASASATVTNRTTDIITSSIGVATGIASKTAFGAATAVLRKDSQDCAHAVPGSETTAAADGWFLPRLSDTTSSDTLIGNYCAISSDQRVKLPEDDELLKNAILAYDNRISTLAQTDADLLRGGTTVFDKVAQMNRIETEINARLIPLFVGHKTSTTWNASFDVRKIVEGAPLTLFKLDPKKCLVLNPEVGIPPDTKPMPKEFGGSCPSATKDITLTISYYPTRNSQLFSRVSDVTTGDRSFRYRIPAQVRAVVEDDSKQLGGGIFYVAQLGTVISLPASRHSKSLTYGLSLIEATGGLKTFSLGTTGSVDTSTINSLGSSTETVLTAKSTADAAAASAAAAKSPTAVLTHEENLLELQDEICTIQTKYNLPCTVQPQK
jgi:hypothetical protein